MVSDVMRQFVGGLPSASHRELHLLAQASHNALNTQLSKLLLHPHCGIREKAGVRRPLPEIPVVIPSTVSADVKAYKLCSSHRYSLVYGSTVTEAITRS